MRSRDAAGFSIGELVHAVGTIDGPGTFEGSVTYGDLSASGVDTGAFFVTFDGEAGFVLDGEGTDRLTATLASSDRIHVAGPWEDQLPGLGLVDEQLDPFGIAAFHTFVPID